MKHLVSKEHYPHLKRRAILEFIGFIVLILVVVREWEVIDKSFFAIRESDILYLTMAFIVYWLILPFTALSYKILSSKKIPLLSTTLAQLAGSGPGRIIPGGLGHMSTSILHLKKLGVPINKSIVISLANNFVGIIVNTIIFIAVLIFVPKIRESLDGVITTESVLIVATLILFLAALALLLYHVRKIKRSVLKVDKQVKILLNFLLEHPSKFFSLTLISMVIIVGNIIIFLLCSLALNLNIDPINALIALSIGVLIGGLFPTPGGIGGVEAGIAATLVVLGYGPAESTSIALLYRTVTYWQPLIPGTFAYLYLREKKLL